MKKKSKTTPTLSGKISSKEALALTETWIKYPQNELTNMFFTRYIGNHQRAITYYLYPDDMKSIAAQYAANTPNCRLKVSMSCDKAYDPQEVMEVRPAFTPLVQLINLDGKKVGKKTVVVPSDIYKCNWLFFSTIPITNQKYYEPPTSASSAHPMLDKVWPDNNPSLVSPKSAHLFIDEWCMTDYANIDKLFSGLVYGQVSRVKSYTFLEDDVAKIMDLYNNDKSKTICVHLAVIEPNINTPFPFHVIIEVGNAFFPPLNPKKSSAKKNTQEDGEDVNEGDFFEFSYPCPPFCKPR